MPENNIARTLYMFFRVRIIAVRQILIIYYAWLFVFNSFCFHKFKCSIEFTNEYTVALYSSMYVDGSTRVGDKPNPRHSVSGQLYFQFHTRTDIRTRVFTCCTPVYVQHNTITSSVLIVKICSSW